MCNYCGCREIETVAALTAEHQQLLHGRAELGRALARGDLDGAVVSLRSLVETLTLHDAVEELGFYPALLSVDGYADQVGRMFDEHDELDAIFNTALAAATRNPAAVDWPTVRSALDHLARHIDAEEHGLFPAAAVSLDAEAWERIEDIRSTLQRG